MRVGSEWDSAMGGRLTGFVSLPPFQ